MSIQEIKRFNEDVVKDEALQAELKEVGSDVGKLIEIANTKGYDFSEEDLKEAAKKGSGELTDDQLDDVAGGTGSQDYGSVIAVVVGPIAGPISGPAAFPMTIVVVVGSM